MFFWNSLAFLMIQQTLATWSLVPLPFLKPAWNIWKFMVHILLKPGGLENFEHYFTRVWHECNCAVVGAFLGFGPSLSLGLEWRLTFSRPMSTVEFSKFADILSAALSQHHLLEFESSTGIPSPPLASLIVMLPKAHLTSHSRMSGSRWVIIPLWLSGS